MITVFNGIKMLGLRDHHGQWWKVSKDCIQCGQCCEDRGPMWHFAQDEIVGGCKHLIEHESGKKLCGLRSARPFSCCGNSPIGAEEYCSVEFEKVASMEEVVNG